jgi:hypothetical protein
MAHEFAQAQFALLLMPDGGAQGRTQHVGQQDKQHAPVEITQRAVLRGRGKRGEMKITFPRLEHQFDLPP